MKTTYLLLLSLTLTSSLQAADSGNSAARPVRGDDLSLSEVTAAALANNPAIKEALRKWNAARARIPQAAAWDDPRLGGDSRVRRYVDDTLAIFHGPRCLARYSAQGQPIEELERAAA